MTREDTIAVLSILKTAYPRFYSNMTRQDAENTINLWAVMFAQDSAEAVKTALYKLIAVKEFPPTIADLKASMVSITMPSADWSEAWGRVSNAIHVYGQYRFDEAAQEFDEITVQCVKRLGWSALCTSEKAELDRANFRMIYQQEQERRQTEAALPEKVKQGIAALIQKSSGQRAIESKVKDY